VPETLIQTSLLKAIPPRAGIQYLRNRDEHHDSMTTLVAVVAPNRGRSFPSRSRPALARCRGHRRARAISDRRRGGRVRFAASPSRSQDPTQSVLCWTWPGALAPSAPSPKSREADPADPWWSSGARSPTSNWLSYLRWVLPTAVPVRRQSAKATHEVPFSTYPVHAMSACPSNVGPCHIDSNWLHEDTRVGPERIGFLCRPLRQ